MKNRLFCLLLMVSSVAAAQSNPEITRERTFVGTALYGFMNGGSDLFYEYGFDQLVAREVNYKGEEFIVENYRMKSTEDAFGIYSLHTFRCLRVDSLDRFECQSQYQLQAARGDQYISIVFQSGSDAARYAADELLNIYAPKQEDEKADILQELASFPKPYSGTVKMMRGPIAVNNIYSDFLPWLEGMSGYSVWLAEREGCALFVLKDASDFNTFKSRVSASSILKEGENSVLVKL
jgi:hypothetical protein